MTVEIGAIVGGKVTGITKFGAFVALEGDSGVTGLVHISEVAHSFVNDITEHLTLGQEVKVKVVSIGDGGKVGLSIKKATEPPERQFGDRGRNDGNRNDGNRGDRGRSDGNRGDLGRDRQGGGGRPFRGGGAPRPAKPAEPETFEDRLTKFMQDSNKNLSGSKIYSEKKTRRRGRD